MQTLSTETHQPPALTRRTYFISLEIHEEALRRAKNFERSELGLLEIIKKAEDHQIYFDFELTSLYQYCVELLKLSPHVTSNMITVMRKMREVPELAQAVTLEKVSVSKARKICPVLTSANAGEWIDLACTCSARVVEKTVAAASPRAAVFESMKYVASDVLEFKLAVSEEWAELLVKTKDLLAQKESRAVSSEEALFMTMREFIKRHDPVEKAARADTRNKKAKISANQKTQILSQNFIPSDSDVTSKPDPKPTDPARKQKRTRYISANIRHKLNLRDRGQCVYLKSNGLRCEARRWTEAHHVVAFADGGKHGVDNLVTLCSVHHRRHHGVNSQGLTPIT